MERRRNTPTQESWCSDQGCLFPEILQRWDFHNDPLIDGEEPSPGIEACDYEDPYLSGREI
ncbi:MAG: hypothetical protein KGZ50_10860 [Peptococcaceae bacterium]|nr:hypothetical protein [Peptococcaceae bacterium]